MSNFLHWSCVLVATAYLVMLPMAFLARKDHE